MSKPAKRYLIINPFGIGDVLFTTPLLTAIKDANPDNFIGYWCNERVKELFINHPKIDTIVALSRGDLKKYFAKSRIDGFKRFWALIKELRRLRFDVVFDFSLDHRYGFICKLLRIPKRIGLDYKNRGRFLTHSLPLTGYADKHVVDFYLDLLQFDDITPTDNRLTLFVPESNRLNNTILLEAYGIHKTDTVVCIAPGAGASWGKNAALKHWPAVKFAHLADRLITEMGVKVIVLGDASEKTVTETMLLAMKQRPINFTGKTTLEELLAMIANCSVLVTNDGGPLHIAAAVGTRTVSIFGPVDEIVYGPYPASDKHIRITYPISCRPCYKNFRMSTCDRDRECLNMIDENVVFNAVKQLLSERNTV
ncbi:MAG TPA: glycosyltransferase family 9 protein [Candidatus Omnitrophota bacterium]|nr:glycosyltransferase family 9 protein [Candidatus Omnitrophota bacterium]HPT07772.1 glycosyltransferase family 9 protein [Candidatus Omnitrophota bacterium]